MLEVSGDYEKVWYHSSVAKEADYDTWFFRIDSTGGWALTPTLSMLPSVYYVNTTNSSDRSQLVPSGDPVLPPVSITNYGNTNTEDFGAAVNFNYLATHNLTIGVNGNYSEQRFGGGTDNTAVSGLTNSRQIGGNASVSYLFSPRTSLGILGRGKPPDIRKCPGLRYPVRRHPVRVPVLPRGSPRWRLRNVVYPAKRGPGDPGTANILRPSGIFRATYTPRRSPPKYTDRTFIPGRAGSGRPPVKRPPVLRSPTSSPGSGPDTSPGPIRSANRSSRRNG